MLLDAFRIAQRGGQEAVEIYVTVFQAKDFIDRYEIDRWSPKNPRGYQRLPSLSRLRDGRGSAVRYLVKEMGCFPTSILVNVRGELTFTPERDLGWCAYGKLDTGDERFWLMDGQHRVEALKRAIERNADFEKYPIIASVLKLPSRFDELMHFYIVNRRQKSVPTDLAYRHLQRMLWERGTEWLYDLEGRRGVHLGLASEVVDYLSREARSPWYARIRMVGSTAKEEHLVTDKVLISSIAKIFREKAFEGMPIRDFGELMIDYWNAVRQIYPDAFESENEYTLVTSTGINALHQLFPAIYARCARGRDISEESMLLHLEKLLEATKDHTHPDFQGPLDLNFWSREYGPALAVSTGSQAANELYRHMLEKMRLAEAG